MSSLTKIFITGKLLLLLCLFLPARAQETQTPDKPVLSIVIIGNDATDENVIRRELLIREGDIPTADQIRTSQQRLLNLFLFTRVEMYTIPQDQQGLILVIEVTERLYFYPVPILQLNDRDWGKLSYGLSVVHMNFRGQNEKLWGGFWLGYRAGFGFSYYDEWAGDSLHLTTGLRATKTTFDHRTLGFEERHVTGSASIGKWWSRYFNTQLSVDIDRISVDEKFVPLLQSGESSEYLLGMLLFIRHDTRDLYGYPSTGWFNRAYVYRGGIFQKDNEYVKLTLDTRRYLSAGPFTFAGRIYQSYLYGEVPIYRLNYLGFQERIRGHFFEVREGKNIQSGGFEIRFPIIPLNYFSIPAPGVIGQYLRNLKIGLNGGLFIDSGRIWDSVSESRFMGFGAGLHLRLPYVEAVRLDYALNQDLIGELIFEVGVAF